ncbi:MAG: tRNA pseudouridine(13) synthase TruD [candidate division WOR-3 bacterium]
MKIKCRPEDFQVRELIRLKLQKTGRYSIYRLEKRYWNTLDVIREVERSYGLKGFSRAGLKDRYSFTVQYLSLLGKGPDRIIAPNYSLTRIGMSNEPILPRMVIGNRFNITLHALQESELSAITTTLPAIRSDGVANYYDEQRFGSARHKQGFIARKLIAGHYNGALKLFLATPGKGDDSKLRRRKKELLANWGNWERCLKIVPFEGKAAIAYLVKNPRDFEGAVKLLPKTLLELFIVAYQSWLWNRMLFKLLQEMGLKTIRIRYNLGEMAFYETLTSHQQDYLTHLPLPALGPKARFPDERIERIAQEVLKEEGLNLNQLKLRFRIKGLFFKPYERRAIFKPVQLKMMGPEPDELYPGKSKVRLSFILPPGSYATVLLKRLLLPPSITAHPSMQNAPQKV